VAFGDPHEIAKNANLAVSILFDAVGRLKDRLLVIDREQVWRAASAPPRFSWPGSKLPGRRSAGRARSGALPRVKGFVSVDTLF
jgi:hypothetical protein